MLIERDQIEAALPLYEIGPRIGRGRYGLVFSARHRRLGSGRGVKAVVIADSDPRGDTGSVPHRSAVITQPDHPHNVRVHEYAEYESLRLLVVEDLPGGTLTDRRQAATRTQLGGCSRVRGHVDARR